MMGNNKILVAAAGSGKTTHIVREALSVRDELVLIVTYTISNQIEIVKKIREISGSQPDNIHVRTWFSFLISEGVRPFQGVLFETHVNGMEMVNKPSAFRYKMGKTPVYWGEANFDRHYFNSSHCVYSDKLSKLVVRCNDASGGSVFNRLSRIYRHIYVDEVQDLAGYDLDVLDGLFRSTMNVTAVGDPRQVVYLTHHERRFTKYAGSNFLEFFQKELPKKLNVIIDDSTLHVSHRNSAEICKIASLLYPALRETEACQCPACRPIASAHSGMYIVSRDRVGAFLTQFQPTVLRHSVATAVSPATAEVLNFGESKGLGFDSVLIYPTAEMALWLVDHSQDLKPGTRARFYVALTRARHTVGVVHDYHEDAVIEGFSRF
ncbi:MAG: UvrD-helicase domain-containing protein [Gammaproteobacteria bacterium]